MPMLTPSEMHKVQSIVSTAHRAKEKAQMLKKEYEQDAKVVAETVGSAIVVGFVRGKMEAADGSWNIPGTGVDIEGVAGLALVGAALSRKVFGKHDADAIQAGSGILAHYAGQLARKFAKTGTFSLVAGE
jgi:hypothetical protein